MQRQVEAILTELLGPFRPAPEEENPEAPRVLVAVSGGIDSMCLADVFRRSRIIPFAVAHCNFQLRGEEADADEALVRSWTAKHGIPFHSIRFNTEAEARQRGVSIEMAARELRYGWFRYLCTQNGYRAVVTAHNANDNAETLLLNLLRGTGIKGMLGMSMRGSLPVGGADIPLLRPLLKVTRQEIATHAKWHNIPFREDRTNAEDVYRRNRIRNNVFPELQAINPSFVLTLLEDMERLRAVDAIADDYYLAMKECCLEGDSIDIDRLRSMPHWEYILYRILVEQGFTPAEARMAEDMLKGGRQISGTTIGCGEKVLYGAFGKLVISEPRDFWEEEASVTVDGPGTYAFGNKRIVITEEPWDSTGDPKLKRGGNTLIADARALPYPFTIRGWKHGDYLRPIGLSGRKKVQDLFTDLKLSLDEKHETPILVRKDCFSDEKGSGYRDHVSAVLPYRIDAKLRVTRQTPSIIRLTIEK